MRLARLVVSAAASGSGKTSLVAGLLEAMRRRGLSVAPFKAGPDYLDPAIHSAVLGVPSRNLDFRLMGASGTMECLRRAGRGRDLALIEGAMGYYDGEPNSSADLARRLDAPAALLIDARASAESAAAVALGFARYRRRPRIAGFVANRISSGRHYSLVRAAVEARTGLPVFGYLPEDPRLALPSRHLGLVAPDDNPDFAEAVRALGDAVSANVDVDALLAAARSAPELPDISDPTDRRDARQKAAAGVRASARQVVIAVARDEAFGFYYEDNFDVLRSLGARLAFFSPLRDAELPAGSDALYLGGGYPELSLDLIERNASMRESIRAEAARGLPIYAECGGYLYLLEGIEDADGTVRRCVGLAPGIAKAGKRLEALGYREGSMLGPSPIGKAGGRLRGHVFHYYRVEEGGPGSAIVLSRLGKADEPEPPEGYRSRGLYASFLHSHFSANRAAATAFVRAAARYARGKGAQSAR